MGLITKEIEVDISSNWRRYEKLGYKIPKVIKQRYRKDDGRKSGIAISVPKGTTIKINPYDLPDGSTYKILVECDCCGAKKELKWQAFKLTVDDEGKTYCRECYGKFRMSGFLNPNWNPNYSEEEHQRINRSYDPEYIAFIKNVYKRDEYKCRVCGSKINIQAHHLFSWKDNVDLRKNYNNAITLCENCHMTFHKKYGYGKNTYQQFIDWIKNDLKIIDFLSILSFRESA